VEAGACPRTTTTTTTTTRIANQLYSSSVPTTIRHFATCMAKLSPIFTNINGKFTISK